MKKVSLKGLLIVVMVLILSLALPGCKSSDYKEAQGYYSTGNYLQAIQIFTELGDYRDSAFMVGQSVEAYEKYVLDIVEKGDFVKALTELDLGKDLLPSYQRVKDTIIEAYEEHIFEFMETGDYIKAMKELDLGKDVLPSYETLRETIVQETLILDGANQVKTHAYSPTSLQVQTVELYKYATPKDTQLDNYPMMVMKISSQNRLGGYTSNWVMFYDDKFEYGYFTSTLDKSKADYGESLTILMIELYRGNTAIPLCADLARVNRLLSSGASLKLDTTIAQGYYYYDQPQVV